MAKRKKKWSDSWTKKAKNEGYAARSVYKLEEFDRRFQIFRGKSRIVDLGCAPGSWSAFAKKKCSKANLLGVDIKEVANYPGIFMNMSILDLEASVVIEKLGGKADLVLSDIAPYTTGNRFGDHIRQLELAGHALQCACSILKPKGSFVVKVFDGEDVQSFFKNVQQHFQTVKRLRPKATRNTSVEFFMLGMGFQVPEKER
ncbi:MAG: RlmE family RNA methyltransferase [Myxococcota bacterium]|nr:RlmE family RNA methyltransferase [Myxococcota bacterium]